MSLFGKSKTVLEKLRKHEFENVKEKLELLEELEKESLPAKDCIWMLTDKDMKYREVGTRIVQQDKGKATLELLIKEIVEKGDDGKKYILPMVARGNFYGLPDIARKFIASPDVEQRKLIVEIVSYSSSITTWIDFLREAIQDPDLDVRHIAVKRLTKSIKQKKIFNILLPLVQDPEDKIRHSVITAMSILNTKLLVRPFFSRLPHEPSHIQDTMVRTLGNLVENSNVDLTDQIIPVLADEDAATRQIAAKLLTKIPYKESVVRKFLIYTRGIAFWLRDRIFESLGSISHDIADNVLHLLEDEDFAIRVECMFLASYIEDERVVPGVIKILAGDYDWWVRNSAVSILTKFRPANLYEILQPYQHDPDLQWAVIEAYGQAKVEAAIEFLIEMYQGNSRSVKRICIRALAEYKIPETDSFLKDVADQEDDWVVRTEALDLLNTGGKNLESDFKHSKVNPEVEREELKNMGIELEEEEDLPQDHSSVGESAGDQAAEESEDLDDEGEFETFAPQVSSAASASSSKVSFARSSTPVAARSSTPTDASTTATPNTSSVSSNVAPEIPSAQTKTPGSGVPTINVARNKGVEVSARKVSLGKSPRKIEIGSPAKAAPRAPSAKVTIGGPSAKTTPNTSAKITIGGSSAKITPNASAKVTIGSTPSNMSPSGETSSAKAGISIAKPNAAAPMEKKIVLGKKKITLSLNAVRRSKGKKD